MSDRIPELLQRLGEIKTELSNLESQYAKLKKIAEGYMDREETDKLQSREFVLTRTQQSRTSLKKDVPQEIKDKYCTVTKFSVVTLRKTRGRKNSE